MGFGVWISNFFGTDKLQKNLTPTAKIVNSSTKNPHEEETRGSTYDAISEELRNTAITNESISMLANAYKKGVFGGSVSVQNIGKSDVINNQIESIIRTFFKQKNFEMQERFHFSYWARNWAMDLIREGGILIRKHKVTPQVAKAKGWELPYRSEMLELSSIDFNKTDKEKKIFNGVQLSVSNKPVRLHFKGGESISFKDLIMYSTVTRITQYNGVSTVYSSLPSIKRQEDHAKAEVGNAIEQAKVSDVYKAKIADTLKIQASGDFDADLASATNQEVRKISDQLPEKSAKIIDIDEEYVRLDRGSYSSAFEILNKFANTTTAAGSGLTLDEYTGDLSDLTFHGGKVAQIKNDETYSIVRDDLTELVIKPLIEDMLKWCFITGYSKTKPKNINLSVVVTPRRSAEPVKDAIADEKNLKNISTTRSRIVKQRQGSNYQDFLKEYEEDEVAMLETQAKILKQKKEIEIKHGISFEETKKTEKTNEK